MLPTFVIGLREGLEASLIVGIIAAFLSRQGRRDLLRWVYLGVGLAVLLCIGVGATLEAVSADLPQRQQEGLETVVGVLAVGMVTYMVVWMKQHSRELKRQLEGLAAEAMGEGGGRGGRAMVVMAFLAVLREGFETVVFLLAAFNENNGGTAEAAGGAVAGILLAVLLGYGIYRGGVKLNLSKFFRGTGIVLVLVAAGLVVTALHTAHEAGWLDAGQSSTVDLTWLVSPGSVQSALLTGMLGVQEHPVLIEVIGWFAYLVPVGAFVAWPPNRPVSRRALIKGGSALAGLGVLATALLVAFAPSAPAADPATSAGSFSAQLAGTPGQTAVVRTIAQSPAGGTSGSAATSITLHRSGSAQHAGLAADVYTATVPGGASASRPAQLTFEQVAALNGGRLPLGVRTTDANATVQVHYTDSSVLTAWVEPRTGRVLDLRWTESVLATLTGTQVGTVPLDSPVATGTAAMPAADSAAAASAARADLTALDRHSGLAEGAEAAGTLAVLALLGTAALVLTERRKRERVAVTHVTRAPAASTADQV